MHGHAAAHSPYYLEHGIQTQISAFLNKCFRQKLNSATLTIFLEWNLPNVFKQKTKINGYNEGIYARNALQEERLPITEDRARKKGEVVVSWTP